MIHKLVGATTQINRQVHQLYFLKIRKGLLIHLHNPEISQVVQMSTTTNNSNNDDDDNNNNNNNNNNKHDNK